MRGRKPTPTEIKLRGGNPGRRPVNEHEPKHAPLDPTTPSELRDRIARAEWDRIAPALARGHVTTVDRAMLIAYCVKYAQWRALETEVYGQPFTVTTKSGYSQPNPTLTSANKAFLLVLKAAAELGITPTSRSRVSTIGAPEAVDLFAVAQRARPRLVK